MAVSKMKKLSVFALKEDLRPLIAALCKLRCVEISEEALGSAEDGTALESGGDPVEKSALERELLQLSDALAGIGLKEIEAEGKPFDPHFHEAVMHVEDDTLGENTVMQVLQPGYQLGDTVLRPAMVKVAN